MKQERLVYSGICPICGKAYMAYPAISRVDNQTFICPECGQRQALESIGVMDVDEQNKIIGLSRRYEDEENYTG